MDILSLIIAIVLGIIAAVYHKKKGYLPIAGFCWGFFFSVLGLAIVLIESEKNEQSPGRKKGLSTPQWALIFIGTGILLMLIVFAAIGII